MFKIYIYIYISRGRQGCGRQEVGRAEGLPVPLGSWGGKAGKPAEPRHVAGPPLRAQWPHQGPKLTPSKADGTISRPGVGWKPRDSSPRWRWAHGGPGLNQGICCSPSSLSARRFPGATRGCWFWGALKPPNGAGRASMDEIRCTSD